MDYKENKWRKNNRKHAMHEGDSGESDSTRGQEMIEVDTQEERRREERN